MASTEQIVAAAEKVGELIAEHPAARKLEAVLERLEKDTQAQRTLTDYNRQLQKIAEKEQAGKPIEVEDKHQAQTLRNQIIRNPILCDLQIAQMDYVDLMRRVDQAIGGQTPTGPGEAMPTRSQPSAATPDPGAANP